MIRTRTPLSARAPLSFACILLAAAAADAQVTVDLDPNLDNSIYSESGNLSNGEGLFLFMGHTNNGHTRRALLRFDVTGIPAGATIVTAELEINVNQSIAQTDELYQAHRVLEQWGESTSQASGAEGMGGPAMPGDATWSDRLFPACDWTTPGGSIDPTPSGSVIIGGIGGYHTFTGAGLAADVQAWIDGVEPNHGWLLTHSSPAGFTTAKRMASRQYPIQAEAERPTLTVTYMPAPGCGAVNYCGPAVLNSSGCAATTWWSGSCTVADDNFTITADGLPAGQFGYFITSVNQGYFMPGTSNGFVCLGSNIGRFNFPGGVISGPSGAVALDLSSFPTNPPVPVLPGDTWNFQCWYRDAGNTSNFSDGLQVTFD